MYVSLICSGMSLKCYNGIYLTINGFDRFINAHTLFITTTVESIKYSDLAILPNLLSAEMTLLLLTNTQMSDARQQVE